MNRRSRLVAVFILVALALVLFVLFRPAPDLPAPPGVDPARTSTPTPQASSRATPSPTSWPRLRLEPTALDAGHASTPNGAFEGRVVSTRTGEGLPAAELTLAREGEVHAVRADSQGAFRFEARTQGRWFLAAATAEGHLPFAPEWGQSPVSLTARAGQVVRGIVVALEPAATMQGRVVDPEGKPIADARISIVGGGFGQSAVVPVPSTFTSNAAGEFAFTAPDDAIVQASHERFMTRRAHVNYAVRLSRRLTLQLEPLGAMRLSISGIVVDDRGLPAEGAVVSAKPKAVSSEPALTARADVEGRFLLEDVEAGTWRLIAERSGSAPAFSEAESGATNVRLQLQLGGALEGRVREKGSDAAIASFTLIVQQHQSVRGVSVIDPDGRYRLDDLEPGAAIVSAVAPGHAPAPELRVTIPKPGSPPATADFELGGGGTLTGTVVEAGTNHPLPGAIVEVEGALGSAGVPVRNETAAGEDGRFTLTGVAESQVFVAASASGHHARIVAVPPVPEGQTGGPVTIELGRLKEGEEPRVELAGIGAMIEKSGAAFRVLNVVPGGGAAEAGLSAGDEVLSIDGRSVEPMTFKDALPLLRGPEGSVVTLEVVKAGDPARRPNPVAVRRKLVRG